MQLIQIGVNRLLGCSQPAVIAAPQQKRRFSINRELVPFDAQLNAARRARQHNERQKETAKCDQWIHQALAGHVDHGRVPLIRHR
jgi:hypothetical protein